MGKIKDGVAGPRYKRYRIINDLQGNKIAEFNVSTFSHIAETQPVYFLTLALDEYSCENVQTQFDVDRFRGRASPGGTYGEGGKEYLGQYLMRALRAALDKQGRARNDQLDLIQAKMDQLLAATGADGLLTVEIMEQHGL